MVSVVAARSPPLARFNGSCSHVGVARWCLHRGHTRYTAVLNRLCCVLRVLRVLTRRVGHVGECVGQCNLDTHKSFDGMTGEYMYGPNGNTRAMQWFAFWGNGTTTAADMLEAGAGAGAGKLASTGTGTVTGTLNTTLGLYAAAHDPLSRLHHPRAVRRGA